MVRTGVAKRKRAQISERNGTSASKPAIFLQDACFQHRYIRSRDLSAIVERPERLRAVTIGLSAAISRLEGVPNQPIDTAELDPDDLASQLAQLNIQPDIPVTIIQSSAYIDILNHPAVKYVHGDVDGDVYLENLVRWIKESKEKCFFTFSSSVCPESLTAIQGAVGTVCEAVDSVVGSSQSVARAFVAIRPPGHHCGEDTPSGFCFVNNVAIGAAHAHLKYGVKPCCNGTQSIVWQMNEGTYRQTLESENGAPVSRKGPQDLYTTLLSYPCEAGKVELVQAASVSIHGSHGQFIENNSWEKLYAEQYSEILRKAEEFLDSTGGPGEDVLVFISCGMDASEHEMPSMSRPQSTRQYAPGGKLISVLEGGYSDRALTSGSMAHLLGLADKPANPDWWSVENLVLLEKATKKKRGGGRQSIGQTNVEPWLDARLRYSQLWMQVRHKHRRLGCLRPPSSMTLRDRSKKPNSAAKFLAAQPPPTDATSAESSSSEDSHPTTTADKKLPRVILRLGPAPGA
ncbi:histone deacetylase HOS3 [Favolaschia claudopus]|uniref:Histone deacetylase HOS3 n=1 Tax=Favolaschia claudopus TaxID=2862362 RepID=A0AAW0B7T3_9AGAR